MNYNFTIIMIILIIHFFLLIIPSTLAGISAIITFGDSSVDSGNNNALHTVLRSDFEPYGRDLSDKKPTGRFCNGYMVHDFLLTQFGLHKTFVPAYLDATYKISDLDTGVSFASAGSGYDNMTSEILNVIPLSKQVEYFKEYQQKLIAYAGSAKAKNIISEALYIVSAGTSDIINNYFNPATGTRKKQYSQMDYEEFLVGNAGNFITEIYNLGARKIVLAGLPPIGCFPLLRVKNASRTSVDSCDKNYNFYAMSFSNRLVGLSNALNGKLAGVKIVVPDIYGYILDIMKNPSSYVFDEAGVGCCDTGSKVTGSSCNKLTPNICSQPSRYVYWDDVHFTQRTNSLIAVYFKIHTLNVFS